MNRALSPFARRSGVVGLLPRRIDSASGTIGVSQIIEGRVRCDREGSLQRRVRLCWLVTLLTCVVGCSFGPEPEVIYEPPHATRQLQPEPVYSRLAWGREPHGVPPALRADDSPYFQPVISFELVDVTLREAVNEIAQTIGYRSVFQGALEGEGIAGVGAPKTVTVRVTGSVREALQELERQSGVKTELDHKSREVRVLAKRGIAPRLP